MRRICHSGATCKMRLNMSSLKLRWFTLIDLKSFPTILQTLKKQVSDKMRPGKSETSNSGKKKLWDVPQSERKPNCTVYNSQEVKALQFASIKFFEGTCSILGKNSMEVKKEWRRVQEKPLLSEFKLSPWLIWPFLVCFHFSSKRETLIFVFF